MFPDDHSWHGLINLPFDYRSEHNNLNGPLPWELSHLSSLTHLLLLNNLLSGTVPTQYGNFLQLLLHVNKLEGTIPPDLFMAGRPINPSRVLTKLHLGWNLLTGTIPTEVGISQWDGVLLNQNQLSGSLPNALFGATNLQFFILEGNQQVGALRILRAYSQFSLVTISFFSYMIFSQIRGTVPPEISQLSSLAYINIGGTGISGSIPTEVGLLSTLVELRLANTDVGGTIPEELYESLSNLQVLDLSGSQLSGTISTSVGLWSGLIQLSIASNNFSGALPEEIGSLTNLRIITLNGNAFTTEEVPEEFCAFRDPTDRAWEVVADCTPDSTTGIAAMACPITCCTSCCDPTTGICKEMYHK